jgi:mannose/fructose/N-acetylgalactosamine-specific phosphotransferase system component IIC
MRNVEPTEGRRAPRIRIAVLAGFPLLVAVLIGALSGNLRSGLVLGAGIGFGLALSVVVYERLTG